MADTQRVEFGFEGGKVVPVRLSEDEPKDLRKQVEKGLLARRQDQGRDGCRLRRQVVFLRIDAGWQKAGLSVLADARSDGTGAFRRGVVGAALWWRRIRRLPLRAALLGGSAAPVISPSGCARCWRPSRASGCWRSPGTGYRTLDIAEWGGPRAGLRSST